MVRAVRTSLPGRLGAVVVALVLTGAPALAAHPETTEHRCQCKGHSRVHECECARCHEATPKAQRRSAAAQDPPCHRAVAKDEKRAPPRELAGGPCMRGVCGGTEQQHGAPLTPLDAFTREPALASSGTLPAGGRVDRPSGMRREAPSVPETPPPRAASATAGRT